MIHQLLTYSKTYTILFILGFVMMHNNIAFSQDQIINFDIKAQDVSGRGLSNVQVSINQNGKSVFNEVTSKNGRTENYQAFYEYNYIITFAKEGYVSKSVEVNTIENFNEEDVEDEITMPFNLDMVRKQPGVNYAPVENKPVGRFYIDPNTGLFDVDRKYSSNRKKEIDAFFKKIEDDAKNKEKRFKELVKAGDKSFKSKEYQKAIDSWKEALKVKDDDNIRVKIADADILLDEQNEKGEIEEKFNQVIKDGDNLLASDKFDEAIAKYKEAQTIKPKDKLPITKIAEANKKREEQEANKNDKAFNDLITKADKEASDKNYDLAIKTYEEAQLLKPKNKTPSNKIKEINLMLTEKAKNQAKYDKLMTTANDLFKNTDYKKAKESYQLASALMPTEDDPKTKIEEINKLLAEKEKEELAAKDKKKQYESVIKEADKLLTARDYKNAKINYNKALEIKPDETYPKDKLKEIENALLDLEKNYNELTTAADKAIDQKEYQEAIKLYKQAQELKPNQTYPKDQIAKANKLIRENEAALSDLKEKQKQYKKLIATADKNVSSKNYTDAITAYTKASELIPEETYPKEKIKEINTLIAEVDKTYNQYIASADGFMESGKLKEAIERYEQALEVKNDEYPKNQIAKAKELLKKNESEALNAKEKEKKYNKLLAEANQELSNQNYNSAKAKYQEALTIKEDGEEAKKQITLIDNIIAKRKQKFDELVAGADKLFDTEDYQASIIQYEEALLILPIESYPKEQIKKAKNKLKEKNNSKLAEAEKEAQYKNFIESGNVSFGTNDYKAAKDYYTKASSLKPNESYPKSQLALIDKELARLAKLAEEKNAKNEKERALNDLIKKADSKFNTKNYEESKTFYKQAGEINNTPYIQSRIDEINALLKNKTQLEELKKQYDKIIAVADKKFSEKDYEKSKSLYKRAMTFNPSDTYPPMKIAEIDEILARMALDEKEKQKEQAKKLIKYERFIKKGDKNFGLTKYSSALESYKKASKLRPEEGYPKQKIEEINKLLTEQKEQREKYKELSKGFFDMDAELYGEEVKMDESDIGIVISKTSSNAEYRKYLKVKNFLDSANQTKTIQDTTAISSQFLSYEKYKKIVEVLEYERKVDDIGRKRNIRSADLFNDFIAKDNGLKALKAYNENGEISTLIEAAKEDIRKTNNSNQVRIDENTLDYDALKNRYAEEAKKDELENTNKTSEIGNEITSLKENLRKFENNGVKAVEKNELKYNQINDRYAEENTEIAEKNTDKTSEIATNINDLKEVLDENKKEGQQAIDENAEVYNELNNRYAEEAYDISKEMLDKQSEIALNVENLKDNLIEDLGNGQILVQKNQESYDEYNNDLAEAKKEEIINNVDKTSEISEQTEKLKEDLRENAGDGQKSIDKNTELYNNYNENLVNNEKNIQLKNTNKTGEIANQTTLLKEKIDKENQKNQKPVELIAQEFDKFDEKVKNETKALSTDQTRKTSDVFDKVEDQKEKIDLEKKSAGFNTVKRGIQMKTYDEELLKDRSDEAIENITKTFETATEIEIAREEMEKLKSDEVASRLALIFPQGVTQKMYQRKNGMGEVTEVTIRRIVVDGNKANEYIKSTKKTGTVYFKNGLPVDETTYSTESAGDIVNE